MWPLKPGDVDTGDWLAWLSAVGVGVAFLGLMESLRLSKAELASSTDETGGEMDEDEEADDDDDEEDEEEDEDDVLITW